METERKPELPENSTKTGVFMKAEKESVGKPASEEKKVPPENLAKKIETITLPGGIKEVRENDRVVSRKFPNGDWETFYENGQPKYKYFVSGREEYYENDDGIVTKRFEKEEEIPTPVTPAVTPTPPTPSLFIPRRPKAPVPPTTTSTPTPTPQAPKEGWFRRQKTKILMGLGLVAGVGGGYVANEVFSDDKEPTPAVSPATNAELEAINASLAQLKAERQREINIQNSNSIINQESPRAENEAAALKVMENQAKEHAEQTARIKAQMEEMAAKHQAELAAAQALREKLQEQMQNTSKTHADELARIQEKLKRREGLTSEEAMIHNQAIQNYPRNPNMGGYIPTPGRPRG